MEQVKLSASKRASFGKGHARRLRRKGLIPAIFYGHAEESIPLEVSAMELRKVLSTEAGENVIIDLKIKSNGRESSRTVILKEKQLHPVRREILHVDLYQISLEEKLTATVPIEVVGESPGVKKGGILEHGLWEIEVRCLPTQIPDHIQADTSNLEIGDILHLGDLASPEEVEILGDKDQVVLVIAVPRVVEEEKIEVAPVEEEAEPEVISKGKEEEA